MINCDKFYLQSGDANFAHPIDYHIDKGKLYNTRSLRK